MSFDDEQDFSPFCHDGDDILDELLGTPSSECIDCASPLDGGQSVTDESSSKSDRASSNRYGKDARRGKARRSSSDSGSKAKHPVSVGRRNERERNRVKQVNLGFDRLRQYVRLPGLVGAKKKLSKVDTLRAAVDYIAHLKRLLNVADATVSLPPTPQGAGDNIASAVTATAVMQDSLDMLAGLNEITFANQFNIDSGDRLLTYASEPQLLLPTQHQQPHPYSPRLNPDPVPPSEPQQLLNVEGLSEASIQLLKRHAPHQFPPKYAVVQPQQLPPSSTSFDNRGDIHYDVVTFPPTPCSSSAGLMSPASDVGQSQSTTAFMTCGPLAAADHNANYYDAKLLPTFFDGPYSNYQSPIVDPTTQPAFEHSDMMRSLAPSDGVGVFVADSFGGPTRSAFLASNMMTPPLSAADVGESTVAQLKAWLMTDS